MESVGVDRRFWHGKKVFLTGHTGFKGGWLALWLSDMGADVYGYALPPQADNSFYSVTSLHTCLTQSTFADIRDSVSFNEAFQIAQPEIVFHLAAQPLVRYSYAAPEETYAINVMGTVNLLEAARKTPSVRAVVNVTTDKCYENHEWDWPYREIEAMGGADPYSSSKACSELVTSAYRRSFMQLLNVALASVRAGNVIGGGDWGVDRIIPDFLRALDAKQTLTVRYPLATRPWQHVLEPLSGYLILAEKLYTLGQAFAEAWNFGPDDADARSVQWIVETLCQQVSNATWQQTATSQPHEAKILKLDSSKAKKRLGWYPRWHLHTALDMTLAWHRAWKLGTEMAEFSLRQIHAYESTTKDT